MLKYFFALFLFSLNITSIASPVPLAKTHTASLIETLQLYQYSQPSSQTLQRISLLITYTDNRLSKPTVEKQSVMIDNNTGKPLVKKNATQDCVENDYDPLGRITKKRYQSANASNTIIDYFSYHQEATTGNTQIMHTQADGHWQKQIENPLHQIIANYDSQHGAHPIATKQYSDLGELVQSHDVFNNVTQYRYDALQREVFRQRTLSDGSQLRKLSQYNDVANQQRYQFCNGPQCTALTSKQKDDVGHVIGQSLSNQDQVLASQTSRYNNFSDTTQQTSHSLGMAQQSNYYQYNTLGQLQQATISATDVSTTALNVSWQHGLQGKLISKKLNPKTEDKQPYQLLYDGAGHLLQDTLAPQTANEVTKFITDDNNGDRIASTDWGGNHSSNTYAYIAGKRRLLTTTVKPSDTSQQTYTIVHRYSQQSGLLTSVYRNDTKQRKQGEIDYQYGNNPNTYNYHRLIRKTYVATGKVIAYDYDTAGRVRQVINTAGYIITYQHDNQRNQLHAMTMQKAGSQGVIITYYYDRFNRLSEKKRGQLSSQGQETLVDDEQYRYDDVGNNQLKQLIHQHGANHTIYTYTYGNGKIVQQKIDCINTALGITEQQTQTYTYDNLQRLRRVTYQSGVFTTQTDYRYDDNGNLLHKETSTTPPLSQFMQPDFFPRADSIDYHYNLADQLIRVDDATTNEHSHDTGHWFNRNGDMQIDDRGNHYAYGINGQVLSYQSANKKHHATFTYYADGLRASASYNGHRLDFYYDQQRLLNVIESSPDHRVNNSASYLLTIGHTEGRLSHINNQTQCDFYDVDRQGNINGGEISNVAKKNYHNYHRYDAYGNTLYQRSNSPVQKAALLNYDGCQYSGQYTDSVNCGGLHYLHARYYNARLQRFMSRDSYCFMNRYCYANDDPVNSTDPSGHQALNAVTAVVCGFFSFFMSAFPTSITSYIFPRMPSKYLSLQSLVTSFLSPVIVTPMSKNHTPEQWGVNFLLSVLAGVIVGAIFYGFSTELTTVEETDATIEMSNPSGSDDDTPDNNELYPIDRTLSVSKSTEKEASSHLFRASTEPHSPVLTPATTSRKIPRLPSSAGGEKPTVTFQDHVDVCKYSRKVSLSEYAVFHIENLKPSQ